uniref:Ig-like domain-containing protein n=1 Tax=Varanus komodoensis TaxID=61221 RepID=A0A8D2LDF8_VARKO
MPHIIAFPAGGPAKEPVPPEVQLLHSSCDSRSGDADIELVCLIQGFYPEDLEVEWLVGGKSGLLASRTDTPRRDDTGYTFSTTSRANVSQADWLEGNTYHCQVTHPATQTTLKSTAKRCEGKTGDSSWTWLYFDVWVWIGNERGGGAGSIQGARGHFSCYSYLSVDRAEIGCQSSGISTYIRQPTPKDLYVNRTPKILCVMINLVSEEGLSITWSREKQGPLNPQPLDVEEELNGTYTAISTLPVTVEEWSLGERFTCTMQHTSFSAPITMTTSKRTEPSRAPKIYLFPPHHEELTAPQKQSAGEATVHLTCLIVNFIPRDISVQWLMNDNAVPEDHYVNSPAMKGNQDGAYIMFSGLQIDQAAWEAGNEFTCMAVHEGFEEKISQRTVQKSSGKK